MGAHTFVTAGGNVMPVPPRPAHMTSGSLMDRQLAEQAANAGRMLEAAYCVADRELALIWQRTMFDLVKLRRARRFGSGTCGVTGGDA